MINRRQFTLGATAGAVSLGTGSFSLDALAAGTPTQNALVIDAMGEVREAYTDELCREMIESGLNSITVTVQWQQNGDTRSIQFDSMISTR